MALSKIDIENMVTGEVNVANGGTGLSSGTSGQFLKFTGSTTLASAADNAGKLGQVLQDSHENETDITSETFTGINLSQAITPSASGNKVLIVVSLEGVGGHSGVSHGILRITKGGSELKQFVNSSGDDNDTSANFFGSSETCVFLDSPNTTSATTYAVECKRSNNAGAWRMNCNGSCFSSITLLEILA